MKTDLYTLLNIGTILFTSIIYASIDTFLLELYLKNTFKLKENVNVKKYYLVEFILLFILNMNAFGTYENPLNRLLFTLIIIIFSLVKHKKMLIDKILLSLFIIFLVPSTEMFVKFVIQYIFDCQISSTYTHYHILYSLLLKFIASYIGLIIILKISINNQNKTPISLRHFKIISIFLSIYFCITVILTNKKLFYIPSVGRTFVFMVLINHISLFIFDRIQKKHHEFVQLVEIEKLSQSMKNAFGEKLQNVANEIHRIKNDMTSLCTVVLGYIDKGMYNNARERLESQITNLNKIDLMTHTGQIAIDAIIDYMLCQMKEFNISFEENVRRIQIPITLSNDLATVLSIALNNAIEASLQVEDKNKTIHLSILRHNNHLIIHIMNPIQKGHKPVFHKTSKLVDSYKHGFGISNMKNIVKRYNGELEFHVTEDTVDLKIIVEIK